MDISIFLAKSLGLYILIVSSGLLITARKIKPILMDVLNNQALLFVMGFPTLIIGILLITIHNIWEADWRMIITIIGWMGFLKGTLRVVTPQLCNQIADKWIQNHMVYFVTSLVGMMIGGYLYYVGCVQG